MTPFTLKERIICAAIWWAALIFLVAFWYGVGYFVWSIFQ